MKKISKILNLKISYKKIYEDLEKESFEKINFSNEFLFVTIDNFEPYRIYFEKTKFINRFNSGINLRTKELLYHIHLVEYKNFVQLHIDIGNLNKCYLL